MESPSAQPRTTATRGGPAALMDRYDALLLDLDGVVYRGDQPVPAALEILPEARRRGLAILFLTNNSARTPAQVARKLNGLGVDAEPRDVLTSAVATGALLLRENLAGRTAFVIGEAGIREALEQAGVRLLEGEPDRADLVVVGWDRGVDYAKLRTASLLVERGARLVATNADASYPAPDGLWPGAGAILSAVTTTTGAEPLVVGKPGRPMFEAAAEATGAASPLMVGDRLDTDIGGAAVMGWDSLLVFSGAAQPADLLRSSVLPTYVAADVSVLSRDVPAVRFRGASESDLPAVADLLRSSGLHDDGVRGRLDQTVVGERRDDSGQALATACLEQVAGADPEWGLLRSVAVRPDLRGTGVGMLVTAAAVASGRARGIVRIFLFTETAERFFTTMGFQPVDRDAVPPPVARSAHAAEECPTATPMTLAL